MQRISRCLSLTYPHNFLRRDDDRHVARVLLFRNNRQPVDTPREFAFRGSVGNASIVLQVRGKRAPLVDGAPEMSVAQSSHTLPPYSTSVYRMCGCFAPSAD